MFAIDHDDKTGFLTGKELLYYYSVTSGAEGLVREYIVYGSNCIILIMGYDDALTSCEAIGLDN